MKTTLLLTRILFLSLACSTGGAVATPGAESSAFRRFMERDYLLGDWGGLRTDLAQKGINFEFFYAGSVPNNLHGGQEQGAVYQGALMMLLDLDSEKLVGYEGGTLHVSSLWLHGEKPFSDRYVGDLNKVNLLDFRNAFRLWEVYYQQRLLDGKLSFKLGQLSIDHDFIVPEYYNSLGSLTLLNQTFFFPTMAFNLFDLPYFPSQHHGLSTTPNATPGALIRYDLYPWLYGQAAVYGGNPDESYSGTKFNLSESEGALSFFEVGVRWNQDTNRAGLMGSLKVGGYFHTGEFVDVGQGVTWLFLNAAGFPTDLPRTHSGNFGTYLLAEQQLFAERDHTDPARQGLTGFFRVGTAPADRNLAELGVDGGLVYKGLLPSRDWDTLSLAGSWMQISDDIRKSQSTANALAPGAFTVADYEAAIEISYKIQLAAWFTLQPSYQHVFHPGGSRAVPNADVLILQTTMRF
jgi:porin